MRRPACLCPTVQQSSLDRVKSKQSNFLCRGSRCGWLGEGRSGGKSVRTQTHTQKWCYSGNFDRPLGQAAKADEGLKKILNAAWGGFQLFWHLWNEMDDFRGDVCSWEESRAVSALWVSDKCQKQACFRCWKEPRLSFQIIWMKRGVTPCISQEVLLWDGQKNPGELGDFHDLNWSIS